MDFLKFLWAEWPIRTAYGPFHLISLGVMVALVVLICFTCRGEKVSDKAFRIITLLVSIVLILFEVYKQVVYTYNPETHKIDYQWYAFPFQFCSTPMYILFLAGLAKPGKFREWCCDFLGTFGLLAGLLVMVMPGDVFNDPRIGIAFQTMIHHGAMVVMGVFMWVTGRAKPKFISALKALAVFAVLVAIATVLNEVVYASGVLAPNEKFNMFFISRHFPSTLPVFSAIYPQVPWIVFLLIYLVGFGVGATIVTLIAMLIAWVCRKISYHKGNNSTHVNGTRIKY